MKHVLIADDTKNIRTLLGKCLQLEGYQTSEAADGKQALDLLMANHYHLAFLDIKMPGMSGTDVLRAIRAAGIGTPVIIITAYATVKNAVDCTQLGAVAYLHKPFTADKIRNVLADIKSAGSLAHIDTIIKQGKYDEAIILLQRALAERPLDGAVYYLLAKVHDSLGHTDESYKYAQISKFLIKKQGQ